MSEIELEAKKERQRISHLTGREKGLAMCAYFKKYHHDDVVKSEVSIVKPVVNLADVFDGALPLSVVA